ncbi:MAG: DUF423 domain-containing protein [Actinomycetota bacterium]
MTRTLVVLAGVYGLFGVAFGAFGAHALKERVSAERLERLQTGVRYLFYDLPGLLAIAWLSADCEGGLFEVIGGWAFGLGILLFSGSLIALALTGNPRWGAVTPVGGVLLLVGWASVVAIGILLPGGTGSTAFLVSC